MTNLKDKYNFELTYSYKALNTARYWSSKLFLIHLGLTIRYNQLTNYLCILKIIFQNVDKDVAKYFSFHLRCHLACNKILVLP